MSVIKKLILLSHVLFVMKVIQCFIASSIVEFYLERIFIGDFIRRYNDENYNSGIRIRLNLCEDESSNYQPIYDRKIRESDIFIAIVGKNLGTFTEREITISAGCDNNRSRFILSLNNELTLANEILSKFTVKKCDDVLKTVYETITEAVNEVRECINDDATYYVSNSSTALSLNVPRGNGEIEVATLGNIIRRCRDEEYLISVDERIENESDVYLSIVSQGHECEINRLQKLIELGLSESLWVFNGNESLPQVYKQVLNSIGNYPDDYETVKELAQIFHIKLLTALIRYNNDNRYRFVVSEHIIYRQVLPSGKRYPIKNLSTLDSSARSTRKERVIVNILNIYKEKEEASKLQEALFQLEKENYEFFVYNKEILGDLPIKQLSTVTADFFYDRVDLLQRKAHEIGSKSICSDIDGLMTEVIGDHSLHYSDKIKVLYYITKIYLDESKSYEAKKILEYIWDQCVSNALAIKKDGLTYLPVDVANDLCIVYDELDLITNKSILLDTLFKEFSIDDFKLSSFYAKSVWSRFGNIPKEVLTLILGAKPECYNRDNDALRNYIEALVNLIFIELSEYFDGDGLRELSNILPKLRECYNLYLNNGKNTILNGYIFVLESIVDRNISLCKQGIELVKSSIDNYFYEQELLYCLALLYHKNGLVHEEIQLLENICKDNPKEDLNKAVYLHNLAVAYNSIYQACDAESTYLKAIEIFSKHKAEAYLAESFEGLSYSYAMMCDFDNALQYATKACRIKTTNNRICNYITALLGSGKYCRAYYFFYLKVNDKLAISKTLEYADWPELAQLGVNVSNFNRLFKLYHKFVPNT